MPLLLEYGWVLLVLIALEGILAADNAVVLAMIVRHLPENERKKLYFMGLQVLSYFASFLCSLFLCLSTFGKFKQ